MAALHNMQTMPPMHAFYADHFVLPLPSGHRFPMEKYRWLRDRIATELPDVVLLEAPAATDGELALVHSTAYIQDVVSGTLNKAMQQELGFPWSPEMVERSRRSVGATVAACRSALRWGVSGNLAGGTHHAYADRGSGFCVFNDVAVAARLLQVEYARLHATTADMFKVLILDLDVHQGNGTAAIFAADSSVCTVSVHGARNFPFHKETSDWDAQLDDGANDVVYLQAVDAALRFVDTRWNRPDLVIYLAGADPYEGDRLGRLAVTQSGLIERDRRVLDWAWQRRVPLAMAMAGGYGRVVAETVQVQINTWQVALHYFCRWNNGFN